MVTVPVRLAVPVYASAVSDTVPFPEPPTPAVTVIQESLLTAVQLQPAGAVTVTVPPPPAEAKTCDAGEIVSLQAAPT